MQGSPGERRGWDWGAGQFSRDITSGPHDMYYSKDFSSSLSLITHSILIFRSESMEDSDVIDSLYYGLGYEDIV